MVHLGVTVEPCVIPRSIATLSPCCCRRPRRDRSTVKNETTEFTETTTELHGVLEKQPRIFTEEKHGNPPMVRGKSVAVSASSVVGVLEEQTDQGSRSSDGRSALFISNKETTTDFTEIATEISRIIPCVSVAASVKSVVALVFVLDVPRRRFCCRGCKRAPIFAP